MSVAFHHNRKGMVGQGELHQLVSMRKNSRGDIYLTHGTLDIFRQFDAEDVFPFRAVDEAKPFGRLRYGRPLYQERIVMKNTILKIMPP